MTKVELTKTELEVLHKWHFDAAVRKAEDAGSPDVEVNQHIDRMSYLGNLIDIATD